MESAMEEVSLADEDGAIRQPRLWSEDGWTAEVIKNDNDDGWAVAMFKEGQTEPALIGPWTMGRDKKNPKPLDRSAFLTLVKTAGEFIGRLEQQQRARLRKDLVVGWAPERVFVSMVVVPDEDYPYAVLEARDEAGELLGRKEVEASFKFGEESVGRWIASEYTKA